MPGRPPGATFGQGAGQEPELVIVHGNGLDHRNLLMLDQAFAAEPAFRRHYLDLPGYGATPPLHSPGGLPELADWLEDWVHRHLGRRRFVAFGQSMGGLLCQELADRMPERILGLGLLAPVVFPRTEERTLPPRTVLEEDPQLLARLPLPARENFRTMTVLQNEATWRRFAAQILPGTESANLRAMARLAKRYDLDPVPVRRRTQLRVPVVVISGAQDHIVGSQDARLLQRRYPLMSHHVIERAGHNVHVEQPAAVVCAVRHWLREVKRWQQQEGQR